MTRSKRFSARVDLEREVLTTINTSTTFANFPLAGLTHAAIANWQKRTSSIHRPDRILKISEVLLSIAREAGLLADNSRAVFAVDDPHIDATISTLLEILSTEVATATPIVQK